MLSAQAKHLNSCSGKASLKEPKNGTPLQIDAVAHTLRITADIPASEVRRFETRVTELIQHEIDDIYQAEVDILLKNNKLLELKSYVKSTWENLSKSTDPKWLKRRADFVEQFNAYLQTDNIKGMSDLIYSCDSRKLLETFGRDFKTTKEARAFIIEKYSKTLLADGGVHLDKVWNTVLAKGDAMMAKLELDLDYLDLARTQFRKLIETGDERFFQFIKVD